MSSLIHQDFVIATGQIAEDADQFTLADGTVVPKAVVPGAILVADEPQGPSSTGWVYAGGTFRPAMVPADLRSAELAADIRAERNRKLAESDWTQALDAGSRCDQAAWAAYRQQLCDITAQAGFPKKVVWPVNPNGAI